MNTELTAQEKIACSANWRKHHQYLEQNKLVSEETLRWLLILTKHDCIGYDQGDVRPNDIGRWDVYYFLWQDGGASKQEAMLASNLTAEEIAGQERRNDLEMDGVNPDDPVDVKMHEIMKDLPPDQLNELIDTLEQQLGLDPL